MKQILLVLSVLIGANAFAEYPFTISGDKINTIFQSEQLRKIGGAVETIVFKGHSENTSKFAITTTESIAITNASGGITGFQPTPCLVIVDVTATGDGMNPNWKVTNVDFTACPKTTGK